jgi:xanthine dehydrogenase molybdopterin-binding subunit B
MVEVVGLEAGPELLGTAKGAAVQVEESKAEVVKIAVQEVAAGQGERAMGEVVKMPLQEVPAAVRVSPWVLVEEVAKALVEKVVEEVPTMLVVIVEGEEMARRAETLAKAVKMVLSW